MAGSPRMRARAERWAALKQDSVFAARCIERIALGDSVKALAAEFGLAYTTFFDWINDNHMDAVRRARKARALSLVEANEANAERVDRGDMSGKQAMASARIREWAASRYDRDTFGDRSQVDMKVTGTVDMHLQAMRSVVEHGATYDGELAHEPGEPVEQRIVEPELAEHPLL